MRKDTNLCARPVIGRYLALVGLFVAVSVLLLSPADVMAQAAGDWSTSEGQMTLSQSGVQVSGHYATDNGEIVGTINGNILHGYWIEDSSGRRCATAKNGRYHWGRIRYAFSADNFQGQWSYCDASVSNSNKWTGKRIGGAATSSSEGLLDNWNRAGCQLTDTTRFRINGRTRVAKIEVWYRWRNGERSVPFVLTSNQGFRLEKAFEHTGSCDPFQRSWCVGDVALGASLKSGVYTLKVATARQCQNAGSKMNGFVRIFGTGAPIENLAGQRGAVQSTSRPVPPTALSGVWKTSEGVMTLTQSGLSVSGRYTTDNGEIVGTFRGNVLDGYWIENGSNKRCATTKNGRHHWGRIQFIFSSNSFQGRWSYCDDLLSNSNKWNGQR